jgi:hypothetical protein
MNSGSMVTNSELMNVLAVTGADKDEEGKYFVRGGLVSFMGMGDEWVLDETAQYRKNGEWKYLLGLVQGTSYHRSVGVIL